MKHRVLIIGLGRIGMGYDLELNQDQYVLSHARAFSLHNDFELVGGVDLDPIRCQQFNDRYGCKTFNSVRSAVKEASPSLVVVATPTDSHYTIIKEIISLIAPSTILCEKPIAFDIEHAREIVQTCRRNNCHLFVNYMRSSDVGVGEIKKRFNDGTIQTPVNGMVWYSGGLLNSASHLVNLCQRLLGDVIATQIVDKGINYLSKDPDPDFKVRFKTGEINFLALRDQAYFHNTIELLAKNGRLRYEYGGEEIVWQASSTNKVFSGYTMLMHEYEKFRSDFFRIQWHVADQLSNFLSGKIADICDGNDALITLEVLAGIKSKM